MDTMAKISTRFKRLSVDKSLWRDQVVVKGSQEDPILRFGHFPVTKLVVKGGVGPVVIEIPRNLTSTYPNLEEVTLHFGRETIRTYKVSEGDCPFFSKDGKIATSYPIRITTWGLLYQDCDGSHVFWYGGGGGDDLGPSDEVKVFNNEGEDEEATERTQAELLEEKSSLITESEKV